MIGTVTKFACCRVVLSNLLMMQAKFYEAVVRNIDTNKKTVTACFPDDVGVETACFQLDYDILVIGKFSHPMVSLLV